MPKGVRVRNDGGGTLMVAFFPLADNKRFVAVSPADLQLASGDMIVVDVKVRSRCPHSASATDSLLH